jgi:hypothetical protein
MPDRGQNERTTDDVDDSIDHNEKAAVFAARGVAGR